jgi:hypothetical protein
MARHSRGVAVSARCLLAVAPAAVMAQGKTGSFEGYAEWRQGQEIIVDGQRVRVTASTKFKGTGDAKDFTNIPLGYEVKVSGTRKPDGTVEATSVETKANGTAMFEAETLAATQQLEASFLDKGFVRAQPEPHPLLKQGRDVDPDSWTAPVTATIFVDGTPLNTFTSRARDVVITSLLHAGRSEIALVSSRVAGVVQDNDIEFTLFGPVEWEVQQKTFVGPKVVQFSSMQGWRRDAKTGSLTNAGAATADKIERVILLVLKVAPAVSNR